MRALAIATFAAAVSLAVPANAATIINYKVSGWDMAAFTDDRSGRFTHCAASARYRSGILLLFSLTDSFRWSIGFSSPDWNLRQGRDFDVDFRIDGGRLNTVRGIAANNRLIRATLPDSVGLFNQFRQGLRLVVRVDDNAPVTFNLTDTNVMLTEILRCAQKYKGYVARTGDRPPSAPRDASPRETGPRDLTPNNSVQRDANPRQDNRTPLQERNTGVGSSGTYRESIDDNRVARRPDRDTDTPRPQNQPTPPPSNTPTVGPTAESRAEAVEIATDILRRANFTFEMQKPEQLADNLRNKYDAVWRSDGILGTLRILSGSRDNTVDKIRGELIASDAGTCKGKFASGALPAMSGSQSQTIYTSCESQNNWSVYYIAVPRRKGGIYLLGIAGTGETAARVQNVASAYRTVALEVLEK